MDLLGCEHLETIDVLIPEYRCKYFRQVLMAHTAQDICMVSAVEEQYS